MKILHTLSAIGKGSYYVEDVAAFAAAGGSESQKWCVPATSPGFQQAREIAETLAVGFVLEDGFVAWGDCVGVSYAGRSGREGVFRAQTARALLTQEFFPQWAGKSLNAVMTTGLPRALAYGVSAAKLVARAHLSRTTVAEMLCADYALPLPVAPLSLHGSCGNDRKDNVEKMIRHRLDVIPHTQVEHVPTQFGGRGEVFLEFCHHLVTRLHEEALLGYRPALHFDLHGALSTAFADDLSAQTGFVQELVRVCAGFDIRLESPVLGSSLAQHQSRMQALRAALRSNDLRVRLYWDEWLESTESLRVAATAADGVHIKLPVWGDLRESLRGIVLAKQLGLATLVGGSCVETDLSSKLSVHVALASGATELLVKPGMGINEGVSIVSNEMQRALQEIAFRRG